MHGVSKFPVGPKGCQNKYSRRIFCEVKGESVSECGEWHSNVVDGAVDVLRVEEDRQCLRRKQVGHGKRGR